MTTPTTFRRFAIATVATLSLAGLACSSDDDASTTTDAATTEAPAETEAPVETCLLYTSDAADD